MIGKYGRELVFLLAPFFVLGFSANSAKAACDDTPLPQKLAIERNTANLDTGKFFETVRSNFDRQFRGWAVIFTGNDGVRMGFYRRGWAVHPCDVNANGGVPFDLNTETAIGSITKLMTTVAALKAAPPSRLSRSMVEFLPDRWRANTHSFYEQVAVSHLLSHQAGFRKGGGGVHISERLRLGPELPTGLGVRKYSNTGFGLFHFIYAGWSGSPLATRFDSHHKDDSNAEYNRNFQDMSSRVYNLGIHQFVTSPLKISATCNPRSGKFPPNEPALEHFPFFPVARSHSNQFAHRGVHLNNVTRNCASGGLYMSAKDLSKFMAALDDSSYLSPAKRKLMINSGPAHELLGFDTAGGAVGGRAFWKNGGRLENGGSSVAGVIRFQSGAHAVFVANSPIPGGVNVPASLVAAYNNSRS